MNKKKEEEEEEGEEKEGEQNQNFCVRFSRLREVVGLWGYISHKNS